MKSTLQAFVLLAALGLGTAQAHAQDIERKGLFGGFDLGVAQANIDPDSPDSAPGLGGMLAMRGGWRWDSGLALSAGLTASSFTYNTTITAAPLSIPGQPTTDPVSMDVEAALSLDFIDLSAWYFLALSDRLDLALRGGAGLLQGQLLVNRQPQDKNAWGAILSAGLSWQARRHTTIQADLYWRPTGLAFADVPGFKDNISTFGLSLGVGWSP